MDTFIFCDSCGFSANEVCGLGYRVYTTPGGAEFHVGSEVGFCSGCKSLAAVETFRDPFRDSLYLKIESNRGLRDLQACKSALEKLIGELDTPPKGLWQTIYFAILSVPARRDAAVSRKQKEFKSLSEEHQRRLKEQYAYERFYPELTKRNPRCLKCGSERVMLLDRSTLGPGGPGLPYQDEVQVLAQTHPGCGGRFMRRGSCQHSDIDDSKHVYDTEARLISGEPVREVLLDGKRDVEAEVAYQVETMNGPARRRIVMLDNDIRFLEAMKLFIEQEFGGAKVLSFTDAEEAFQELERGNPDLFTIESAEHYGKITGDELLGLLALGEAKYPILVITGRAESVEVKDGMAMLRSTLPNVTRLSKAWPAENLRRALKREISRLGARRDQRVASRRCSI